MGKFRLAVAAALVALLGGAVWTALPAKADCTTNCYGSGAYRTCNTHCW